MAALKLVLSGADLSHVTLGGGTPEASARGPSISTVTISANQRAMGNVGLGAEMPSAEVSLTPLTIRGN